MAIIQRGIERSPALIAALGVFKPPDKARPGSTTMAQQNEVYRVVIQSSSIVLCMPVCTWMNLARLSGKKPNMNHHARQNTGQNVSLQASKHWARGTMTNQHGK